MRDIEAFARVRLGPGTLYGALQRLERARLIEAVPSTDRRQPYRLTAAVSLHCMHYNFARPHQSLGRNVTPAMAAGVSDHVWTFEAIAALID